jgi:hypothetical protein
VACILQDERGAATGPPQDGDDSWVDVGRHDASSSPAAASDPAAPPPDVAQRESGTATAAGKLGWRRYLRMYVAGAAALCLRQPPSGDSSTETGFVLIPSRWRGEEENGTT